ncbi:MAG TPA: DegQ family serine endoprotease [Kofleriaceae bacterium]|nr:DegQ family serine endoprotease [Kofleriaceae bacterium]
MTTTLRTRARTLGLVIAGAMLGVFATCAHSPENNEPSALVARAEAAPPLTGAPSSLADVAEKAVPSVVNISATRVARVSSPGGFGPMMDDPGFREFFGDRLPRQQQRQHGLGSGVIVSADGVILTNNHVIAQAEEITVTLHDGRDFKAKVVGTDPKSDLAVLRLEGKHSGLKPASLGSSTNLRLGEVVLAVGNPFGVGQTVTMGIVSATGRSKMGIVDYEDFIQTDASINPGNSGGALVNMRGELIGINTAILSRTGGSQGIGFAIPIDMVRPIMDGLLKNGTYERGWLGVAIQDLNDDLAKGLGLSVDRGVLISDVTDGSPAAKAGLKRGDVVLELNGKKILTSGALRNRIAALGPGTKADMVVARNGVQQTVSVTLGSLASSPGEAVSRTQQPDKGPLGGVAVGALSPAARQKYGIDDRVKNGVVVTGLAPDSPARAVGLREGDVIVELDRKPLDSVSAFNKAYKPDARSIVLLVNRQGNTVYLALRN